MGWFLGIGRLLPISTFTQSYFWPLNGKVIFHALIILWSRFRLGRWDYFFSFIIFHLITLIKNGNRRNIHSDSTLLMLVRRTTIKKFVQWDLCYSAVKIRFILYMSFVVHEKRTNSLRIDEKMVETASC